MTGTTSSENAGLSLIRNLGFPLLLLLLALATSVAAPGFLAVANVMGILHSCAPIIVISSGMALVVMMGKIDISVGSMALLANSVGALALTRWGLPPEPTILLVVGIGAVLGAVNGLVVTVLKVSPLIATLGSMIAFRGLGLQLTDSQVIVLPDAIRLFGNLSVGPVFIDIAIAGVVLAVVHFVHRQTSFGRTVTAIGNSEKTATRIGLPVGVTVCSCFVISGALAGLGGAVSAAQVGSLTTFLGRGMEFTSVAVVVVGGISLFGGRGAIFSGVLLGALTFELIRNALNYLGANPYLYQLIGGGIIFVAMYAAAMKARQESAFN
jgi:ribose/xylose/arabinose/galactoside ABC-type transport system permease subunit